MKQRIAQEVRDSHADRHLCTGPDQQRAAGSDQTVTVSLRVEQTHPIHMPRADRPLNAQADICLRGQAPWNQVGLVHWSPI